MTSHEIELGTEQTMAQSLPTSLALSQSDWLDNHSKDFIDQWTAAGLSKYVSLPVICVLGDTSSGKSSLLSSLVGLELPSASTLTTKCPVLIQLKKGIRQEATIDIQWFDDLQTPKNNNEEKIIGGNPSLRQRKRSIEKQVGDSHLRNTILDNQHVDEMKDDNQASMSAPSTSSPPLWDTRNIASDLQTRVPILLKEAQDFILRHRPDMLISPDVICLSIQSPTAERELTLVDLPGLVAYQHTHDSSLLSQVEQVVMQYVHNPRSILVPIIAAPTNIHNSKVLQWCKTVDPTTARTIPVLTKPDLIDPGSEADVVGLLRGSEFSHHGFYMVKNRGQASLDAGASIADGLQEEADFFASTDPWTSIEHDNRLGVPALRSTLAVVLLQVMRSSLPDILAEIEEQYHAVDKVIDAWGEMLLTKSEQRKFYHSVSQKLTATVSANLSGKGQRSRRDSSSTSSSTPAGAARLHSACSKFLKDINSGSLATIATLVEGAPVLVSTSNTAEDVHGEIVHIDHDAGFVCVDYMDDKDHTTDVLFDAVGYTADDPDFEKDEVWSDGSRVFVGREAGLFDSLRKLPIDSVRTDPAWLTDKIAEFRTDDLACFINVEMFRNIVREFVRDDWTPPCKELLKTLDTILGDALHEGIEISFNNVAHRYPLLKSMMEDKCRDACKTLLNSASQDVQAHLEIEENHPYTQDEILLQTLSESRFNNLRRDLEMQLKLSQEGVVFDTQGIKSIFESVFSKHRKMHWMAEQMELVLSCYGKVATQRVLDRSPQICWQTCRKLPGALHDALGSVTDDILEKCLWESPDSKDKYQKMVATLKDLQEVMEVVKKIT